MEEAYIINRKIVRCRHCGGAMRDYRDGISCLLCGRSLEHSCDHCRNPEEENFEKKVMDKKVA